MSDKRVWKLVAGAILLLGIFLFSIGRLMRDRLEQGDIYPEYSTHRSDPLGAKALFDALDAMPGLEVDRYVRPLEEINKIEPGTFFYLGDLAETWQISASEKMYLAMERWMRDGGRIVITLQPERSADSWSQRRRRRIAAEQEERERKEREESRRKKKKDDQKQGDDKKEKEEEEPEEKFVDLETRWKIGIERRDLLTDEEGKPSFAAATAIAQNWPELIWQSVVFFRFPADSEWKTVVSRDEGSPVVVERSFGKGSLVLVSDSYLVTNEGLWRNRHPEFLSWLIGDHKHVYFDEGHLGSSNVEGVATLARRYGLFGGVYMLGLLTVLFVWRNARSLAPSYPELTAGSSLGEESSLAMVSLLRRSVAPVAVIPLCIAEWLRSGATAKRHAAEVQAMWQDEKSRSGKPNVVEFYQRIQQFLRKRR